MTVVKVTFWFEVFIVCVACVGGFNCGIVGLVVCANFRD